MAWQKYSSNDTYSLLLEMAPANDDGPASVLARLAGVEFGLLLFSEAPLLLPPAAKSAGNFRLNPLEPASFNGVTGRELPAAPRNLFELLESESDISESELKSDKVSFFASTGSADFLAPFFFFDSFVASFSLASRFFSSSLLDSSLECFSSSSSDSSLLRIL